MRAIVQHGYGGPEVLSLDTLDDPTPGAGQVVVRVRRASVNQADWHLMTGLPRLLRPVFGLSRPRQPILGNALAGEVLAVGAGVTGWALGERVAAELPRGAFAEQAIVPAKLLARVPADVSLDLAATVPVAGISAQQALVAGGVDAGVVVLVIGASGGVGSFAVQLAKARGATVIAVCSARNRALVLGLGADEVIAYDEADATVARDRYDVVVDMVGDRPAAAWFPGLKPGGRYVAGSGGDNGWLGPLVPIACGVVRSVGSGRRFVPLASDSSPTDLALVLAEIAAGRVRPPIDRRVGLDAVPELMRYQGTRRTRGKHVIEVG